MWTCGHGLEPAPRRRLGTTTRHHDPTAWLGTTTRMPAAAMSVRRDLPVTCIQTVLGSLSR
jgi:hypothetical protein